MCELQYVVQEIEVLWVIGKFHTLVKSYLEGRYQTVTITNSTSNCNTLLDWMDIKHGVPQDSILSPLFMCINDLQTLSNMNTKVLLYADNISVIVNSPSPYNYQIIMKDFV